MSVDINDFTYVTMNEMYEHIIMFLENVSHNISRGVCPTCVVEDFLTEAAIAMEEGKYYEEAQAYAEEYLTQQVSDGCESQKEESPTPPYARRLAAVVTKH